MARSDVVFLRETWPEEWNSEFEENCARREAEKRAPQELQDAANRVLIRIAEQLADCHIPRPEEPATKPPKEALLTVEELNQLLVAWSNHTGRPQSHLFSKIKQADGETPLIDKKTFYQLKNDKLDLATKPGRRLVQYLKKNT